METTPRPRRRGRASVSLAGRPRSFHVHGPASLGGAPASRRAGEGPREAPTRTAPGGASVRSRNAGREASAGLAGAAAR
jgi:hypothetical protein